MKVLETQGIQVPQLGLGTFKLTGDAGFARHFEGAKAELRHCNALSGDILGFDRLHETS